MPRTSWLSLLLVALVAWVLTGSTLAEPVQEHGKDTGKKAADKKAAGKEGHGHDHAQDGHDKGKDHAHEKPEIFPWALDLGLWTLVVFLGLLFVLRKAAWGPMLEGLRKREETIRAAVEEAKIVRAEMDRARAEHKAQLDKAYAEIPKMMEEARRDAQRLADELRAKAMADIQTERQRLRRELETARDQALQQLWQEAAQLATLISARAIRRSLTPEDQRRLTEEALAEVRQAEERWKTEGQL